MELFLQYGVWVLAGLLLVWMVLKRRGDIASTEARKLVGEGARLIDVRTAGEYAGGHIPEAVNIPVESLRSRLKEVGAKETPVILYCASGARSAMAARLLKAGGWSRVHNLGAMSRW